jgi:hypothetical protein
MLRKCRRVDGHGRFRSCPSTLLNVIPWRQPKPFGVLADLFQKSWSAPPMPMTPDLRRNTIKEKWIDVARRSWFVRPVITRFNTDATMARRSRPGVTGERRDTEMVMRRSEKGGWKSADRVTRWPPTLLHVRICGDWRCNSSGLPGGVFLILPRGFSPLLLHFYLHL